MGTAIGGFFDFMDEGYPTSPQGVIGAGNGATVSSYAAGGNGGVLPPGLPGQTLSPEVQAGVTAATMPASSYPWWAWALGILALWWVIE